MTLLCLSVWLMYYSGSWLPYLQLWQLCLSDSSIPLPHTRDQAAQQERAVALDEGREEGKHTVDGEGDEEGLPSPDSVGQAAPQKSPNHHPQVHDQTWREGGLRGKSNGRGMSWEEIMRRRETKGKIMSYYSSVNSLILLPASTCTFIKLPLPSKLAHLTASLDSSILH